MDDLPLLVNYFIGRMNRELDRRVQSVSPEAMLMMKVHNWPGNVRELQSCYPIRLGPCVWENMLTAECLAAPPARWARRGVPAAERAVCDIARIVA